MGVRETITSELTPVAKCSQYCLTFSNILKDYWKISNNAKTKKKKKDKLDQIAVKHSRW